MNDIHIILTGGTIEKSYDPLTEKPEFKSKSIVPEYMRYVVKAYPEITYEAVAQLDSLDMTEAVQGDIVTSIEKSTARRVIIVHGTSTMANTAQYLVENLPQTDKTIILTGAMIPLKEFAMSDAGFNLGYAIAQVKYAQSGIYVAMNARLFKAGTVVKNIGVGRFEEKG